MLDFEVFGGGAHSAHGGESGIKYDKKEGAEIVVLAEEAFWATSFAFLGVVILRVFLSRDGRGRGFGRGFLKKPTKFAKERKTRELVGGEI